MATVSFDRKMCISKNEVNHFLKIINEPAKRVKTIPNIEEKMKESEKLLEKCFLHR
ncbi:hypothetical protein [Selenomonas sp.]|jgi:hypothetical protein|uniref:hypothetical protein n=1 Tax=Selenomonas sp. TaxID=2053611 RepID=UPI0028F01711|nr:hypothetical protein [uncultured Selenomonas sp.]